MAVRNCREIGENLQKIVQRLIANDNLVKLLYYENTDPLSKPVLSQDQKQKEVFNKLIKIVPRVGAIENSQSIVAIRVLSGSQLADNKEFKLITIGIEVFVPLNAWLIKDTNLRPFAILGEIQESLQDKTVNGLGHLDGGDFELSYVTDEITCYEATYTLITYD